MTIVKIINSNQGLTQQLVGEVYNAISMDLDTGNINVYDERFNGQITLKNGEYEYVIH